MLEGFITNEGKAFARGARDNGAEGDFVLDAEGNFVSTKGIHFDMMFQFTREQVDFSNWTEDEVIENARILKDKHTVFMLLPEVTNQELPHEVRIEFSELVNELLGNDKVREGLLDFLRKGHRSQDIVQPLISRDAWDYDQTIAMLKTANADKLREFIETLKAEEIF